jgi:hypothetical protein
MLPEEILLEIFSFYVCGSYDNHEWKTLVHVCRRWRAIVFAAPRHLNLRLVCTERTPVSEMFDIWSTLPIVLQVNGTSDKLNDNLLAALEKHDRICEVRVFVNNASVGEIKELAGAMQVTFPALTDLYIHSMEDAAPLPETFLDGSAPNLQSLYLIRVAFPALPRLLLSSPGLVSLYLSDIPVSGYNSPDSIVDCLSSLTRLEYLQISFPSSRPPPYLESRSPPLTRTFFPVLATLFLEGVMEFLDQILARIEAPLLDHVHTRFFDPPIFDISRLAQCICRTETFEAFDQVYMGFCDVYFHVVLSSRKGTSVGKIVTLSLQWNDSGWELRELTLDPCDRFFEPFNLCEFERTLRPSWEENTGNEPWLHLVRCFHATKYMYLSQGLALRVAPALQELTGERVTEVLPVLRNIFVQRLDSLGPVEEAIGQFLAARRPLSGHPIDIQCWIRGERINH